MYSMSPQTALLGSTSCGYPVYQAAKAALQQQVTETVLAFSITKYIGFSEIQQHVNKIIFHSFTTYADAL